jgi:hypothetical protein
MRTDVHFAALRAAAKVAFSMALLNGCSSADAANDDGEPKASGDEALTTSDPAAASTDCPDHTCSSVLKSEFPRPGNYRTEPEARSQHVVDCCKAELKAHNAQTRYRWDCCVAFNPETGEHASADAGWACTPWGPPVPPSMERLAARRARRAKRSSRRPVAAMAVA